MSEEELFNKRVYGIAIVESKLANYNADFTGSPRTLPDGTVYATDKVWKYKVRDYMEKNGEKIFVKTKYKENGNPMTLEEIYKFHFHEDADGKNKTLILKNLLSMIDVRLFGATFAKKGNNNANNNVNFSIHGPVQISYGVNRFEKMRDSGMFTDQIGSPFASKSSDSQTTLGSQTRSFEAHYVYHFSINPKNLSMLVQQVLEEKIIAEFTAKEKKGKLDKKEIEKKINEKIKDEGLKTELKNKLKEDKLSAEDWEKFIADEVSKDISKFNCNVNFQLLTNGDIERLKEAFQVAVTAYDSTSKKGAENEFLMWVELKNEKGDQSSKDVANTLTKDVNCENLVLRNFSELVKITKEDGKTRINLDNVFKYLEKFMNCIEKIEIYYDEDFTDVSGIPDNSTGKTKIVEIKTLGSHSVKQEEAKSGDK